MRQQAGKAMAGYSRRFRPQLSLRLLLLLVALACVVVPWLKSRNDLRRLLGERERIRQGETYDYVLLATGVARVDANGDVINVSLNASELTAFLQRFGDRQVASLTIYDTTDADLAMLSTVRGLAFLKLSGGRITEVGLESLADCKGLKALHLDRTNVGDAAVPSLIRLQQLRALSIGDDRITDKGLESLKNALPDCHVER